MRTDNASKSRYGASNDYLGMEAASCGSGCYAYRVGYGGVLAPGGTRNIGGSTIYHKEMEVELADLHNKPAALLFTSAFNANEAALSALSRLLPGLIVFSDALNHASMIAGISHGKAEKHIFAHNDVADLRRLLETAPKDAPKLIAFESLYSMDGDFAPIAEICDLADEFNAMTYVDEGPCRRHVWRDWGWGFGAFRPGTSRGYYQWDTGESLRCYGRIYRGGGGVSGCCALLRLARVYFHNLPTASCGERGVRFGSLGEERIPNYGRRIVMSRPR